MADTMEPIFVSHQAIPHPASLASHGRHLLELPPECIEAIVRRVVDVPTLFALLLVCKELSAVAEKVIYEDPFKLTVGIKNTSYVHGRLLNRLLPLSPYEDEVLHRMLKILGFPRPPPCPPTPTTTEDPSTTASTAASNSALQAPSSSEATTTAADSATTTTAAAADTSSSTITTTADPATRLPIKKQHSNVLSHLRIFDYDMELYNTTYFHPSAYMITRDIVDHYHLRWEPALRKVQSTVGWACYGHQLRQLRRLRIPIWDLERFVDVLPSLVNVRVLNFASTKVWPTHSQPEVAQGLVVDQLRIVVEFIKAFQKCHGPERPQQCDVFHLDMGLGGEAAKALERQFYALLPPLPSPTHLNAQNWPKMAARYEQVDLSRVTDITYTDMRVDWPDRQHRVLERCQSLEQLNCLGLERDMFIFRQSMPRNWCNIRGLRLQCNGFIMRDLVDSAMVVLHGSLTTAIFTVRTSSITLLDPELTIGKHWPSFPYLQTLHIQSKETIFLHPHALHDAPKLESLYFLDETNLYNPYTLVQLEPWRLPNLRSLYLQGVTAIAFHPQSFATLPQLANATMKGVKLDARRYFMPRHADNTPRGMPSAHLWTWDWEMAALTNLRLEGELAYRFDFQWLDYCPQLTELSLKIGGHHRPMLLSPAITARIRAMAGQQQQQQQKEKLDKQQQEEGSDSGSGGESESSSPQSNEDEKENAGFEERCSYLWELEDDIEPGKAGDWLALEEAERRGLLTRLVCQPRPRIDPSRSNSHLNDNDRSSPARDHPDHSQDDDQESSSESLWVRSNLEHLELQGRWLMTDLLLQRLLFRNLRRLKYLTLHGPKGYTRWGLLECTRRHRCLERVESSQMVTRADAHLFWLENPEARRWTREGWRGGIQEWNTRPARDSNRPRILRPAQTTTASREAVAAVVVETGTGATGAEAATTTATTVAPEAAAAAAAEATAASAGEAVVVGWDWEALDPEKTRRTKMAWWEQVEKAKETDDKKKGIVIHGALKTNAKAPVPKAQPLVPADASAPTVPTGESFEDDGAPGPSSYVAGLILDEKERLPPVQQQEQSVQAERTTTTTTTTAKSSNASDVVDEEAVEQGYVVYQFMRDHFRFKKARRPIDLVSILD